MINRESWRGKMGIGIGSFCRGKMGLKPHWDWDLVTGNGKKMLKIKNGNEIWALRSGISKKNGLGSGSGTLLQGLLNTQKVSSLHYLWCFKKSNIILGVSVCKYSAAECCNLHCLVTFLCWYFEVALWLFSCTENPMSSNRFSTSNLLILVS